jgi:ribose 5-phosphate isomerase A
MGAWFSGSIFRQPIPDSWKRTIGIRGIRYRPRKGKSDVGGEMGMNLKKLAAAEAVRLVEKGMIVGLGTGSTTRYAIEMIGERLRDGRLRDIVGIPTSSASERLARRMGIPLSSLQEHPVIDLTIDGADEVGPDLVLNKGQGGALLHEKIVACASRRLIIIVDDSKLVTVLGSRAPLAVEVVRFGWGTYLEALRAFGCEPVRRMQSAEPYLTDEGNYIVDCHFTRIDDPVRMERELNLIPGVVENGIFNGLTSLVYVASQSGIRELRPE